MFLSISACVLALCVSRGKYMCTATVSLCKYTCIGSVSVSTCSFYSVTDTYDFHLSLTAGLQGVAERPVTPLSV